MKTTKRTSMVLVTAPDRTTARRLAKAVLTARLAACVNLVPGLESHYWWEGRLEQGRELLLLIKTTRACLEPLEELVLRLHPYDTPEFVVVELAAGSRRYLDWIDASVARRGRTGTGAAR